MRTPPPHTKPPPQVFVPHNNMSTPENHGAERGVKRKPEDDLREGGRKMLPKNPIGAPAADVMANIIARSDLGGCNTVVVTTCKPAEPVQQLAELIYAVQPGTVFMHNSNHGNTGRNPRTGEFYGVSRKYEARLRKLGTNLRTKSLPFVNKASFLAAVAHLFVRGELAAFLKTLQGDTYGFKLLAEEIKVLLLMMAEAASVPADSDLRLLRYPVDMLKAIFDGVADAARELGNECPNLFDLAVKGATSYVDGPPGLHRNLYKEDLPFATEVSAAIGEAFAPGGMSAHRRAVIVAIAKAMDAANTALRKDPVFADKLPPPLGAQSDDFSAADKFVNACLSYAEFVGATIMKIGKSHVVDAPRLDDGYHPESAVEAITKAMGKINKSAPGKPFSDVLSEASEQRMLKALRCISKVSETALDVPKGCTADLHHVIVALVLQWILKESWDDFAADAGELADLAEVPAMTDEDVERAFGAGRPLGKATAVVLKNDIETDDVEAEACLREVAKIGQKASASGSLDVMAVVVVNKPGVAVDVDGRPVDQRVGDTVEALKTYWREDEGRFVVPEGALAALPLPKLAEYVTKKAEDGVLVGVMYADPMEEGAPNSHAQAATWL